MIWTGDISWKYAPLRVDLTYYMLYGERGRQSTGIIILSQSRALHTLELFIARSTVSSSPALSTLMASETLIIQIIQFHIMVSHGLHESWLGRRRESLRIHGQPTLADVGDSCYFLGSADVGWKWRRISAISGILRVWKWASTEIINSLRSPTLVVYNISEIGTLFQRW